MDNLLYSDLTKNKLYEITLRIAQQTKHTLQDSGGMIQVDKDGTD